MTTSRIEQSLNKQFISKNIEQGAKDLMNYIWGATIEYDTQRLHKSMLESIFVEVEKEYNEPLSYPVVGYVVSYYRTRSEAIKLAKKTIQEADPLDKLAILNAVIDFMKEGHCESTSANTLFIKQCMACIPKYYAIEDDEVLANLDPLKKQNIIEGIFLQLRHEFIIHAQKHVQALNNTMKIFSKTTVVEFDENSKQAFRNSQQAIKTFFEKGANNKETIIIDNYQPTIKVTDKEAYKLAAEKLQKLITSTQPTQRILPTRHLNAANMHLVSSTSNNAAFLARREELRLKLQKPKLAKAQKENIIENNQSTPTVSTQLNSSKILTANTRLFRDVSINSEYLAKEKSDCEQQSIAKAQIKTPAMK